MPSGVSGLLGPDFMVFLPACSCHLHGALEAETDASQLPLGPHRLRGGGGEWGALRPPLPPPITSWGRSWKPEALEPRQGCSRLLLSSHPWCLNHPRLPGRQFDVCRVFLISMLTWTHRPPVRSGTAHHADLIKSGGGRASLGGNHHRPGDRVPKSGCEPLPRCQSHAPQCQSLGVTER